MGELVSFDAGDGVVGSITLHSPPANPLGAPLLRDLDAAIDEAQAAAVKVVVVKSGLDRFFAAGADIKLMATLDQAGFTEYMETIRRPFARLAEQISIAAVDGVALGGGLELACACTLRVAARDATLGVPESKLGIIPGAMGTQVLPRLIGRGRALDLLLTGRSISGEEAYGMGLVDRLVEPGGAAPAAEALAAELAALSRPCLQALVRAADAAQDLPFEDGLAVEAQELLNVVGPEGEAMEGLSAFVEKRAPQFQ